MQKKEKFTRHFETRAGDILFYFYFFYELLTFEISVLFDNITYIYVCVTIIWQCTKLRGKTRSPCVPVTTKRIGENEKGRRKKRKGGREKERRVRFALNRQHHAAMLSLICKTYRTDLADATRAVLRLVERYARHSMTALNRQSLFSLSSALSSSPFLSSLCARSRCNRVLFLSALEATRERVSALSSFAKALSLNRFSVRLSVSRLCFHTFPLSITLHSPSNPPIHPGRRSLVVVRCHVECRLRSHCLARSCRRNSLSALPSHAARRHAGTRQLVVGRR